MRYRLIILDFDGTLGDTRQNIVVTLQETLRRKGLPIASEEKCASTIGLILEEAFKVLCPWLSDEQAMDRRNLYRDVFEEYKTIIHPTAFPHVVETMSALKGMGATMVIASSRISRSLNELVRDLDLSPYVDDVLGGDQVAHTKPAPDQVLVLLEKYGVTSETIGEVLVVGDMPFDILMGRGAGVATCGVTYGNATAQELLEAGADYVIDDISGLLEVVED